MPVENTPPGESNVPDPVETRDASSRPVPRRWRTIWLFLLPGIVLIVMGIFWMAGSEGKKSEPAATPGVTGTSGGEPREPTDANPPSEPLNPPDSTPQVIGDLSLLGGGDEYVGRPVELSAVAVARVHGSRTFTVGPIGQHTLVLMDDGQPGAIKPGQFVRISGRIEKPPSGERLAAAGLDDEDRKALEDEKIIIRATRVEPAPEAKPTPRPDTSR
jgi:hypothetical protein